MKTIGIILDSIPYSGGSYQYALGILEAVVTFSKTNDYKIIAFIRQREWRYLLKRIDYITELTGNYIRDALIIDKHKCFLVIGTSQAGWSGWLCTPTIEPIHDLMHRYEYRFPEVSEPREKKERDILFSRTAYNAVGILVDSNIGKKHVLEVFGKICEDRVYILPYAAPKYLDEPSEEISIPFEKFLFYPAQFWPHKNHLNLIKAMALLRDKGIIIRFIFVGSAKNGYDETMGLINKFHLEDQISVLGYVSNGQIKYLYEKARAMVMPTFFGPTNIPPIEAIVMGCPIAVSKIYGMPEQLGDAALYFDPNNVAEIADILKRLWLEDATCANLIRAGKDKMQSFRQKTFNRHFCDILKKIIDELNKNELFERLDYFCKEHKKIYIFGAGAYAYKAYLILLKRHIFIQGMIVSNLCENEGSENFFNKDVFSLDDIDPCNNDGIICGVSQEKLLSVNNMLKMKGFDDKNIYAMNCFELNAIL